MGTIGRLLNILSIIVLATLLIDSYFKFLPIPTGSESLIYGLVFVVIGILTFIFAKRARYTDRKLRRAPIPILISIVMIIIGLLMIFANLNLLSGTGLDVYLAISGVLIFLLIIGLLLMILGWYFKSKEESFGGYLPVRRDF